MLPKKKQEKLMSKTAKKKWHKVGSIWKNDEGKSSVVFELAEAVTLKVKQGDNVIAVELVPNESGRVRFHLQKPEDEIMSLLANGIIDEATAEARKARLPENLRFNVVLPPPRD